MNISQPSDSPVVALLREQFRRTGRPVGMLLVVSLVITWGALAAVRAYYGLGSSDIIVREVAGLAGILAIFTYCLAISILLWGYSDTSNLRAQIPTYALRLPIKTTVLVFWRMFYNLTTMAVLCGLLTVSVYIASYDPEVEGFEIPLEVIWIFVSGGLLVFLLIQTTCWFVSNYKVLYVAVPVFWVVLIRSWQIAEDQVAKMTYALLFTTLIALPIAYGLSVIGVHARRHGLAPLSSVLAVSLGNRVRTRVTGPSEFKSPQQAQRWFESRRLIRMLPVTALCMTILGLAASRFIPLPGIYNPTRISDLARLAEEFLFFYAGATLIGAVVYGGVSFCKNHRTQTNPNSGFFSIARCRARTLPRHESSLWENRWWSP